MLETFQTSMNEYRGALDRTVISMKNTLVDRTENKFNIEHLNKVTKSR